MGRLLRARPTPAPLYALIRSTMTDHIEFLESYLDPFFSRLDSVGFNNLSEVEKTFICVWSLEGEVSNGGFDQWFFNSSGDWAFETPPSLIRIGAESTAKIVKEAISHFPNGNPSVDLEKRRNQMEKVTNVIESKWDELDNQFNKYEDDLEELLVQYMKENYIPI